MQEYLPGWKRHLASGTQHRKPAAPSTIDVYLIKVRHFLAWLETQPEPEVTPVTLYHYITYLQRDCRLRPRTIHQAFAALFRFLGYLESDCGFTGLPSRKAIRLPPLDEAQRYTPSDAEVTALWTAAERLPADTPHARFVRERALTVMAVLRYACLRNFEVRALDLTDVRLDERRLYIAAGKGGRSDWLPIIAPLQEQLRTWLPVRAAWEKEKTRELAGEGLTLPPLVARALFPVDRIHRFGEAGMRKLFRDLCQQAFGQDEQHRVTPHCLRHYGLSTLHRLGVPDAYLSRIARHASIAITQKSYIHTDEAGLAEYLARLGEKPAPKRGEIHPPEVRQETVSPPPAEDRSERHPRRQAPGTTRGRRLKGR